jgi:hypothetical protein
VGQNPQGPPNRMRGQALAIATEAVSFPIILGWESRFLAPLGMTNLVDSLLP